MKGSSEHSRPHGLKGSAALIAAALMLALPASAGATTGVDIAMRTVNNSSATISLGYCPVITSYNFTADPNPCGRLHYQRYLSAHGDRYTFTANPFGGIIKQAHHHTLYFYARNPSVGRPFFEVNGHSYSMYAGQIRTVHVAGATVELHREGDRDGHKQMTINLIRMGRV
jgi:hypothetical protein